LWPFLALYVSFSHKMHHKNEVTNAISVRHTSRIRTARLSTMTHGTVTAGWGQGPGWGLRLQLRQRCADCGLRTQIRSNSWIRGLPANGFFYSEVEMLRWQWILHIVRSAITAIAELLVSPAKGKTLKLNLHLCTFYKLYSRFVWWNLAKMHEKKGTWQCWIWKSIICPMIVKF